MKQCEKENCNVLQSDDWTISSMKHSINGIVMLNRTTWNMAWLPYLFIFLKIFLWTWFYFLLLILYYKHADKMWCKLLDQGTASPPPFFLEKNKKKSHLFYLLFDFCWCCCCCLLLLCLQIFKKLSSFAKLKIDLNKVKKQNKNQYNFYKLLLLFLESPSMFVKKYIFFIIIILRVGGKTVFWCCKN